MKEKIIRYQGKLFEEECFIFMSHPVTLQYILFSENLSLGFHGNVPRTQYEKGSHFFVSYIVVRRRNRDLD